MTSGDNGKRHFVLERAREIESDAEELCGPGVQAGGAGQGKLLQVSAGNMGGEGHVAVSSPLAGCGV